MGNKLFAPVITSVLTQFLAMKISRALWSDSYYFNTTLKMLKYWHCCMRSFPAMGKYDQLCKLITGSFLDFFFLVFLSDIYGSNGNLIIWKSNKAIFRWNALLTVIFSNNLCKS